MRALSAPWMVVVLLAAGVAMSGCILDGQSPHEAATYDQTEVHVRDAIGQPVPFYPLTITAADLTPLAYATTDPHGVARIVLPAEAEGISWTDGDMTFGDGLKERIDLVIEEPTTIIAGAGADANALLGLRTHKIVELGSWGYLYSANMATCRDTDDPMAAVSPTHDCGLSEPTIEVDNAGTIYASSVCCVGGAPPIWVSRDDGATWDTLVTPLGQREAFGIEGDFAIDDVGNLYFFDIELGAVQVSAWTADGTHIHTTHQPAPPLVDRPWVRADGDGTVYLVYNQGIGSSTFLRSDDHGRTFVEMTQFPHNFGNIAHGQEEGELLFAAPAQGATVATYTSIDGGLTWGPRVDIKAPNSIPTYAVPLVDDAGNRYVVFDGSPAKGEPGYIEGDDDASRTRVFYAWAPPGGDWSEAIPVSHPQGTHTLAWGATAAPGALAVAWYGTLDSNSTQNGVDDAAEWFLFLAASTDATRDDATFQTIVADPTPVLTGPMGRRLLDFLQVDIGPDGAIHVAYAHILEGSRVETTAYVQTLANLPLASDDGLRHGPR